MSTLKQAEQEYRKAAQALADNLSRKRTLKTKVAQLLAQLDALSDEVEKAGDAQGVRQRCCSFQPRREKSLKIPSVTGLSPAKHFLR